MMESALFDSLVFCIFDILDLVLTLLFHLLTESAHSSLILKLDLITDSLVIVTDGSHLLVVRPVQSIFVLFLPLLLFLLLNSL